MSLKEALTGVKEKKIRGFINDFSNKTPDAEFNPSDIKSPILNQNNEK